MTSLLSRKAKEIVLAAFYHFGHRLSAHYLERPLEHLYLFLRLSENTAPWVGSTDLGFLDVFHPGTKYYALLNVDEFGVVNKREAVDRDGISVGEAIDVAKQMIPYNYPQIAAVVKRLLRVKEFDECTGNLTLELAVAAGMAYS